MSATAPRNNNAPIRVATNMFQLQWPEDGLVYHYDVMTPVWEVKSAKDRAPVIARPRAIEVMSRLQLDIEPQLFHPKGAYDGRKNLYSFRKYDISTQEFRVPLDNPNIRGSARRDPRMVSVKINFVNVISVNNLKSLLSQERRSNQPPSSAASTALNMLNVFVQAAPRMEHPQIHNAKSFFTPRHGVPCRGFELWRGYFQSVRPSVNKLLVNIDVTVGVVVPACQLEQFMEQSIGRRGDLRRLDGAQFQELRHITKGIKIVIDLGGHKTKGARPIKDLVKDAGQVTFDMNGQKMTVKEYFKQTYNYDIVSGTIGVKLQRGDIFPIQFCRTIEQLYKASFPRPPSYVISDALKFTPENPEKRLRAIQDGWQQLKYSNSFFLSGARIDVRQSPTEVNGKILPPPSIEFGGQMKSNPQAKERSLGHDEQSVIPASADNSMVQAMQARGITTPRPRLMREDAGKMHEVFNKLGRENFNLLVAVLPEKAADIYLAVKRFGDIHKGVATQCIKWTRQREAPRGRDQYLNNLILKINVKLGGINFAPRNKTMMELKSCPTMILGADVSHPGPGSYLPSTTALVASMDLNFSRYKAFIRIQDARLEMIQNLKEMARAAIESFRQSNRGYAPIRIFYYRDGVSEGEFERLKEEEIKALREALAEALGREAEKVRMIAIVVGKRHHVRFFPQGKHPAAGYDDRGNGNLFSGFVADREINHPSYEDFYLQSQPGLKGTSIPAHYTVLLNEANIPIEALHDVSYTLCHVYSRSTRSVKVPAPVYYADLVCRRAKFHYDDLAYSDTMSVDSNEPPHIDHFLQHFQYINNSLENSMYFV
ncbi:hypothetical protein AX16_003763 [Volvariella volvacea WC 439]|nr:hypothetical protein AX16_003763 [Volvariella volvacea WC 439]